MERRQPDEEYTDWITALQETVRELSLALQQDGEQQQLAEITERASQRYLQYYRASRFSFLRSFPLNSSIFMSPVEKTFMWFGSLRPSLSFQLIYALIGHQIEADLEELLEPGGHTLDEKRPVTLASLSAVQLGQLSELQTFTIKEEDKVEREMAKLQERAADHPLSFQFLDSGSPSSAPADDDIHRSQGNMDSHLRRKLAVLEEICRQADSLRLSTLRRVLDVLHNPSHKAHYLLAAAKLQVGLRHLGHSKASPVARQH